MARNQSYDPLMLSPHWHVDCRLMAELPDDRVVSSRFLVNLPFGAIALIVLVFFGWKLSTVLSLRSNIADWAQRLNNSKIELASIKQLQREYATDSFKIEVAYKMIKNRLFITGFLTQLSHIKPEQMIINNVESTDIGIVVRGALNEPGERGTLLIGSFVEQLRKDAQIGPHFREIRVTDFVRARDSDQQSFEITLKYIAEAAP